MTDQTEFRVSLQIRETREGERPSVKCEVHADQTPTLVHIDAAGFTMDNEGAEYIAAFLRDMSDAINAELGVAADPSAEEATRQYNSAQERLRERQRPVDPDKTNITLNIVDPKAVRPRFNPKPRGQ